MAVVTGRPAAEILPLLSIEPTPEIWGLHGAERLYADGRRESSKSSHPQLAPPSKRSSHSFAATQPAGWLK